MTYSSKHSPKSKWHRSFFCFTFLNILFFFKYSCTNIFHRRSLHTFYSNRTIKISLFAHDCQSSYCGIGMNDYTAVLYKNGHVHIFNTILVHVCILHQWDKCQYGSYLFACRHDWWRQRQISNDETIVSTKNPNHCPQWCLCLSLLVYNRALYNGNA